MTAKKSKHSAWGEPYVCFYIMTKYLPTFPATAAPCVLCQQLGLTHCSREPLKGYLLNSADLDQTPQNAASDQGLHCLQIVGPFFSRNMLISQPDLPKIEIGLFQCIVWEGSFSLQWVNVFYLKYGPLCGQKYLLTCAKLKLACASAQSDKSRFVRMKTRCILGYLKNVHWRRLI